MAVMSSIDLLAFDCNCAMLHLADSACCYGTAGGESEPASAIRRWLARNAAAVRVLFVDKFVLATACTRLVTCLPALEDVQILSSLMAPCDLVRLLEALACCPRLGVLSLWVLNTDRCHGEVYPIEHSLGPFAKLHSLTKLSFCFDDTEVCPLADVVRALVPLTGLAELGFTSEHPAVVPAALGQLKALRSLALMCFKSCIFEAGCFDLPNLLSLSFFSGGSVEGAEVLGSVPALPSLTRIAFSNSSAPSFAAQLLRLPRLQHMAFESEEPYADGDNDAYLGLSRGSLSSALLHLHLRNGLTHFPLVLTQLVALEHLNLDGNQFAELPIAITALSRLTKLVLGRLLVDDDVVQLCEKRPLNVRALGDLSGFPALCKLSFCFSEVTLCESMLGAVRHASLASIAFVASHPAPECALTVLQLNQVLRQLGRGSVLSFDEWPFKLYSGAEDALRSAHAPPPFKKFQVALQACGM